LLATLVIAATLSSGCSALASASGDCDVQNNGSSISIGATREQSSAPAPQDRGNGGSDDDGYARPAPPPPPDPGTVSPRLPTRDEWLAQCEADRSCTQAIFAPGRPPQPDTPQPVDAAPAAPDPTTATIEDVAEFAPQTPPLVGEPDGIGVVGMPTNFVVDATEHTVDGEIFDIPVTVRFTPVSYLFDFGDGATRETTSPGTTWEDLDAPQFTSTDTSHSYSETGEYEAQVTIRYAAEADAGAGAGWFPIAGLLELNTPTTAIRVVDVDTALVQRTCDEDPRGPGC
jgi:hypothetical protein